MTAKSLSFRGSYGKDFLFTSLFSTTIRSHGRDEQIKMKLQSRRIAQFKDEMKMGRDFFFFQIYLALGERLFEKEI